MRDEEWLIAGVIAMLVLRDSPNWGGDWMWPVPDMDLPDTAGVAMISNPFKPPGHMGVDILYRSRTSGYYAPIGTPILAAKAGRVWSFAHTARGWNVVVDHGPPFATFYQHLDDVEPWVKKGATVGGGHKLGTMGVDPTDPQRLRHLHFETWWRGGASSAVDPAPMLAGAQRHLWTP